MANQEKKKAGFEQPTIFVPSVGTASWRERLADPVKHWSIGRSARAMATSWQNASGFPSEVTETLQSDARFADISPLLIFPEWQVPLPGGQRPSQNDAWCLASCHSGLVSIAVEGNVDETLGPTVGEWLKNASAGKQERLASLQKELGMPNAPTPQTRYQLLHRTASAVSEAKRFHAMAAIMVVHSFSQEHAWFDDYRHFAKQFGAASSIGELVQLGVVSGIPVLTAWCTGHAKYLHM